MLLPVMEGLLAGEEGQGGAGAEAGSGAGACRGKRVRGGRCRVRVRGLQGEEGQGGQVQGQG